MAKFTPQFSLYKMIAILNKAINTLFWTIFWLSVLPIVINTLTLPHYIWLDWFIWLLGLINIIAIIVFFILEFIVEYVLKPDAENKRRNDFIDNSFNSKFEPNSSVEYYDNDELQYWFYKAATNLFENTFFTYSLTKLQTPKKIILTSLVFICLLVVVRYWLQKIALLPLLQILFSANVLWWLCKHLLLVNKLWVIYEDWRSVFQTIDSTLSEKKYRPSVMRNRLRYETLITKISVSTSNKLFNKYNGKLTKEWQAIKLYYNIK